MRIMGYLILLILFVGCATAPQESPSTSNVAPSIYEPSFGLAIIDYPAEVEAGDLISVWWDITAGQPTNIPYTALRYDMESHPGDMSGVDPGSSGYGFEVGLLGKGPYPVPDEYEALFRISEPGTIYLRVVAEDRGAYYWTDEVALTIKEEAPEPPKNNIVSLERISQPGKEIELTWGLSPPPGGAVEASLLYYSHGANRGDVSGWDFVEGVMVGEVFKASVPAGEEGFLYVKALISASGEDFWSDEEAITVLEGDTVEVVIEAGDFTPKRFNIPVGTTVRWLNNDNYVHHTSFVDGFEGTVFMNSSSVRTFDEKGTYLYFDFTNPEFRGYVVVE